MRRLTTAVGVALIVAASPHASASPARNAVIEGRVFLGDGSRPAAAAKVTLLGARVDGSGRFYEKTADVDRRGRYSFDGVPAGRGVEFALEASYDGGLFVGDTVRIDNGQTRTVDLRVWETTSNPEAISITSDHIFVAHDEDGAGAVESVEVINDSRRAYIGRGGALSARGSGSSPTLGFALPSAAVGGRIDLLDSSLNRLYAMEADFGFAATVAIPPGETTVTFAYPAPGSGGTYDLTRRALYPIDELSVFATDPLEVEAAGLTYRGVEEVGGTRYREWSSSDGFDAGDAITVRAVAQGSSSSNLWLGLGIGLGVIILLTILALGLRSPKRTTVAARPRPIPASQDLVSAIATLDLEHESGALTDAEWTEERSRLKAELRAAKEREPAS